MNENDLRDCFAMFAMQALLRVEYENSGYRLPSEGVAIDSYVMADAMLEARKPKDETGIVAVKRSSTKKEK
jgi:hypothetical protein